ncbi:EAL domain-containing protein [Qipengyuania flava]|nr:EAL domain-containing protein [Qipengyuania flava]
MSEAKNLSSANRLDPTVRQLIGLDDPDHADFGRFQSKRYQLVPQRSYMRMLVHAIAMGAVAWLCWSSVPHLFLGAWVALLGGILVGGFVFDRKLKDADDRTLSKRELRQHAYIGVLKGVVWSGGLGAFALVGATGMVAHLWAFLAFVMMVGSISRYCAPLTTIAFTLAGCAGMLISAIASGAFGIAAIILATALFTCLGVIERTRAAWEMHTTELEMHEKSETVSMLLREFEDGQADWLWQIDTNRRLRSVSPRLAYAIGSDISDIEGKSLLQLISGDGWKSGEFHASLHELAEKLKRKESFSNLIVKVTSGEKLRWWEMSGTPMFDEDGQWTGFRGVGSDVTIQRESSEKIEYLARYDTLTHLPNRTQVNEFLAQALLYAEKWRSRCAVLMIDLDRFKAINDSLGHLVGDRMLAQVASRLLPLMREGELCGRLGGDEFAVVIRDASDRHRIDALAHEIIATLSAPYHLDNQVLYVGASVGSCVGPRDGQKVEELLRNADLALYRAKDEGGGTHFEFEPSLHLDAEERRVLEFSLRSALEKNEFVLHYQPVVDAGSEEVVSFEALIRWNSADHGFVSPAKFIPLAEDTRLIVPIGTWVMREACREAALNWPEHVKVNINVSPEQLIEPDFAGTVLQALSHSGLNPQRLEIEVTESIFMRDANVARKALEQCMALGCSVALDDFGTGYSSLGYLRKLRFTTIKVDRSFVQGAAQNSPESLAIIRAVVAMSDSLGMTTTAEGVENEEEAEMIRQLGCNKIQGYHFGRPMPSEDVHRIFDRLLNDARKIA